MELAKRPAFGRIRGSSRCGKRADDKADSMKVTLKTPDQIEKMRQAGRVVREILDQCTRKCQPGVTTREVDEEAGRMIREAGATGLFLNYPTYRPGEGFPANLCISVNDEVVHGIAGERELREGDIVGLDCGVRIDGWCGDSATTALVGRVSPEVRQLCDVTERILVMAIENIRPGRRWSQIARLMENMAHEHGYGVIREFVGHGIGQTLHEEPKVPNFVSRELLRDDILLRPGLVLAIEPMCCLGSREVYTEADGWTVRTKDGKPAAHYEHTVAVTPDGASILTDGK